MAIGTTQFTLNGSAVESFSYYLTLPNCSVDRVDVLDRASQETFRLGELRLSTRLEGQWKEQLRVQAAEQSTTGSPSTVYRDWFTKRGWNPYASL
jgi:hypothetical protein